MKTGYLIIICICCQLKLAYGQRTFNNNYYEAMPLKSVFIDIPVLPARGPFGIAKAGYEQFFTQNSRFSYNLIYEKTWFNRSFHRINADGAETQLKINFKRANRLFSFIGFNFGASKSDYTYEAVEFNSNNMLIATEYYDYVSNIYKIGYVSGFKIMSKRGLPNLEFMFNGGLKFYETKQTKGLNPNGPYVTSWVFLLGESLRTFSAGYPIRNGSFENIYMNFSVKLHILNSKKTSTRFVY